MARRGHNSTSWYRHQSAWRMMIAALGWIGFSAAVSAPDMAKFSLAPSVAVTIWTTSATLAPDRTPRLIAAVNGTTDKAVSWSLSPGTLSASGLYMATAVPAISTAMATATNVPSATKSADAVLTRPAPSRTRIPSAALVITSANNGQTFQNLRITSKDGNCVSITGASNITIQNVDIGPCAGGGIDISASNGVNIYDSYIHPETLSPGCCDNNDGIYAHNGSKNISIQGNVIAYGESNIEALGVARISVVGNFLLNPRGPYPRGQNVQCYSGCSDVLVSNNYTVASIDGEKYLYPEKQEDSVNFGVSDNITAQNNFITGGHSRSGCGLIADDAANSVQFVGNRLLNTGQCGIGIAGGTNQRVTANKIYNTNAISGAGNTALYVWKQYKSPCGPVAVSNNIADEVRPDGTRSGYWNGGGCDPVILTGNTFNADADKLLTPTSTVFAPPPIPPQPKNCVVNSPYSNNTSLSRCNAVQTPRASLGRLGPAGRLLFTLQDGASRLQGLAIASLRRDSL